MRNHISKIAIGAAMAIGLAGCGLGAATLATIAVSAVTGVGAGVVYYEDNKPSPTVTATPSAAPTPSAGASTISK